MKKFLEIIDYINSYEHISTAETSSKLNEVSITIRDDQSDMTTSINIDLFNMPEAYSKIDNAIYQLSEYAKENYKELIYS